MPGTRRTSWGPPPNGEALRRALVVTDRYSVDVTRIAAETLGRGRSGNRDIELVLALHLSPGLTPSAVAARLGLTPSAASRAVTSLVAEHVVQRSRDPLDGRSTHLRLSREGRRRVAAFDRRLGDYFDEGAPYVKEALDLLDVHRRRGRRGASALETARVMSQAGGAFVDEWRSALSDFGVNQSVDGFALTLIHDRGEARPTQLAHDLGLSTSGGSDLLDRLENVGLVSRSHAAVDRRSVILTLTPLGVEAAGVRLGIFSAHADAICAALARTLRPPSGWRPDTES